MKAQVQDKPEYMYIENEGALFRGPAPAWPRLVYSFKTGAFVPYEGDVPKPIEWGQEISEAEFKEFVAERLKQNQERAQKSAGKSDVDKSRWTFIQHEGALYRGPSRAWPMEYFVPTTGLWHKNDDAMPKDVAWGKEITRVEFERRVAEWLKEDRARAERHDSHDDLDFD